MNKIIKTSIKRSVTVCVLVLVLLAVGVLATLDMSTNLLPDIKLPMLGISLVYPGASAQSVEDTVTAKVEQALQTVAGITDLETTSYDNASVAVLTFDYGTDIDEKIEAIEDAFSSVSFPDGCGEPDYIKIDMNGTATATIAVYNASGNTQQLSADAHALATKLNGIEGVGSVSVLGTPERQIRITALDGLDMTALLAVQALQNENLNIPLGTVMQDGTTVSVRNASDATSLLDVMRLPVQLQLGADMLNSLGTLKQTVQSIAYCSLEEFDEAINGRLPQIIQLKGFINTFESSAEQNGTAPLSDEEVRVQLLNTLQTLLDMHFPLGITMEEAEALLTPTFVHILRTDIFTPKSGTENVASNATDDCLVGKLRNFKLKHINNEGKAVYSNGGEVVMDDNGGLAVNGYNVNAFGRLVDSDGDLVDENGNKLHPTEDEIAQNYYSYGQYVVFTDAELLELYDELALDIDLGIALTEDTVRLVRLCDFDDGDKLTVPLAYVGHVVEYNNDTAFAQYNGMLSATIEVYAVSDANTTDVVSEIKRVIADTETVSNVELLDDKAQFITDSIQNVLTSIIIGGVLAVLVIYLFVRKIGSSLVVSITMPLSVLVALIGLWAMNITLNLVSLGGLAVGIGMLVDNSIVVLESITKRRDRGESVYDACLNGTREVAGSLLASTLTNVCVFFPILFARGLTREIFYDLVWAVLFSIVMSLIVAVTVIPSLYHLIYRRSPRKRYKRNPDGSYTEIGTYEDMEPRERNNGKREQRREAFKVRVEKLRTRLNNASISKLEKGYGKILSKILTKRLLVCLVALVLFGASVALVFTTGTEFMPSVDKGVIEIDVGFDASVSLEDAEQAGKQVADAVSQHFGDKLEYIAVTVGKQGLLATSNSGVIRIQTDTSRLDTTETVQEIRNLLKDVDVQAKSVTVREMDGVVAEVTGGMSGQSVELLGDDMDTLRQAAQTVRERLLTADPQHIVSALDNTPERSKEISFTLDRTLCVERGVDYQTAVMLLRVGMSGYQAANVTVDGQTLAVTVQFADIERDIDDICDIVVGFDDNGAVLLRDVLKQNEEGKLYAEGEVFSEIHRKNGKYSTSIDLEIYGIDSGSAGKTISKTVKEALSGFEGVEYAEGGVTSYLNDAFDGLVISLIAAFVLLYSVMACQFESLTKPFIVIMSIPFSFTGGFLALAITGMTLNVVSFVGLIMLMGVIVNGAIVMIDKINALIEEGLSPQEAVVEGCKTRLRPILMTTLTTVLALVPLALGLGRGGELMQPMGIVVLGGLLLGTAVTLVLIPCFYCIVKRIRFDKNAVDGDLSDGEPSGDVSIGEQSYGDEAQSATASDVQVAQDETESSQEKSADGVQKEDVPPASKG